MRRLCERPGCAGAAEVSYGIDHATLVVWVDNKAESERDHAGRLCRRHANALSVPRGWSIDDRRELIPKLFAVPSSTDDEPAPKTKKETVAKKPRVKLDRPRPSLFEKNDEVLKAAPIEDPDETQAIPWSPRLSGVDNPEDESQEEEEPPVFGRLLGRAFGQRAPEE